MTDKQSKILNSLEPKLKRLNLYGGSYKNSHVFVAISGTYVFAMIDLKNPENVEYQTRKKYGNSSYGGTSICDLDIDKIVEFKKTMDTEIIPFLKMIT